MSRYGHEEVLGTEKPYPPILDFVPPPPYPSAVSSLNRLPTLSNRNTNEAGGDCINNTGDPGSQYYEDSDDYSVSDGEDTESLPEYPFDERDSCLKPNCSKKGEDPKIGGDENEGAEPDGSSTRYPWYSRVKKGKVDVPCKLSDISIREEEYQAALNAGKIHVRGKGQQLFQPILGEVSPEPDRIRFHFFLKKTGILGIIAKSMLALYDEPNPPDPQDAIEYMINAVGYKLVVRDNIKEMKNYKESLLIRYQRLSVENDWLHRALDTYEPTELDINGRPPNPYNALEFPQDEFDFEYDETTFSKLKEKFSLVDEKHVQTQEEEELAHDLENSFLSLEEFDEEMKKINPNYLNLTDISSDEDVPKRRPLKNLESPVTTSSGTPSLKHDFNSASDKTNSPEDVPVGDQIKEVEARPIVPKPSNAGDSSVKASTITNKSPTKRRYTVKTDAAAKAVQNKIRQRLKKKGNKDDTPGSLHNSQIHSSVKPEINTNVPKSEPLEEEIEEKLSLIKLYDPDYENELNQVLIEEEENVKKRVKWFSYNYEEEGFADLCGFGNISTYSQNTKIGQEDELGDDDTEQVPILYDTTDDETGMENIKPEVYGHLKTHTMVGDFPFDSDDDKEFINDKDYEEPELSSDEEGFGRKRKLSTTKYRVEKQDSSENEEENEWATFIAGEDQLIDVMEMEPLVPYSSDEDELDYNLEEPPCYELPVVRSLLRTHFHSYSRKS